MSKKTRTRLDGLKQLAEVGANQIPPLDKLSDVKNGYEGVYKVLKGRKPASLGNWFDREQKRRERALDRRVERMGRPRGIAAAERGR